MLTPRESLSLKLFGGLMLCIAAFAALSPNHEQPAAAADPIKPEDIVSVLPGSPGCISEPLFNELVGHLVAKEKTKANAMFADMSCYWLPEKEKFRVLHIGGGSVEIVNAATTLPAGIWTYIEAIHK